MDLIKHRLTNILQTSASLTPAALSRSLSWGSSFWITEMKGSKWGQRGSLNLLLNRGLERAADQDGHRQELRLQGPAHRPGR